MRVLVDTSVWIDFLRAGDRQLSGLLTSFTVCMHPMVLGELACGNLKNREHLLELWKKLPSVVEASHNEVLYFLEQNKLSGKGIGFIDLHLLASTALTDATLLWTRDKQLHFVAAELNIAYSPS
ncbi:MAG TPA: type II toxin-antitoxin system VapC family toxin [Aeromonadales bacterium]|nr:type II toxin-antitoxin system VapC family toxin [Aeromonadales bacterium]